MERDENSCACSCLAIPGVCFKPSDDELVETYLREKIEGRPLCCDHSVAEFNIYDDNLMPWEILKDDDHHWITYSDGSLDTIKKTIYVFTELCKKKTRVTRRSGRGSWTGRRTWFVKNVAGNNIGYKKLLTFFTDDDNKGKKKITYEGLGLGHGHWIMHEFSLLGIDNYAVCRITKQVEKLSSQASSCSTKTAAADADFRGDVEDMNMFLGDERQLGGGDHDDQPLDQFGAVWDINGWKAESEKELGLHTSHHHHTSVQVVQELPILDAPLVFPVHLDVQEDINMIENASITNDSEHVLNFLDDYGEDWEKNGWITELCKEFDSAENNDHNMILDDTSAVVHKLPILEVMNKPQQVQSVLNFQVEENPVAVLQELQVVENAVAIVQELPVAVWGKKEKKHESYKGLDGADSYDVIEISDDDSIQELPMIGAADDPPKMLPINCDHQAENNRAGDNITDDLSNFLNYIAEMDGILAVQKKPVTPWEDLLESNIINQIPNDLLNFEQVEPPIAVERTNTTLDGLVVMLDIPFCDLLHLGVAD